VKPSLLVEGEDYWLQQRERDQQVQRWYAAVGRDPHSLFDPCFLESEALKKYRESERITSESGNNVRRKDDSDSHSWRHGHEASSSGPTATTGNVPMSRSVQHPLFRNCDYREAEEWLKMNGVAGDILVRPSSKGSNKLAITWAFQYDFFKHIDVEERGRRAGAAGLSNELVILEPDMEHEVFTDLDQIYQSYITPMNDFVSSMMQHRCFRHGSVEEVEDYLRQQRNENPKQIPYCVRLEPNKPGCFVITWMSLNIGSTQPIKKELLYIRPNVIFLESVLRLPGVTAFYVV
jgi:hypothetical protein